MECRCYRGGAGRTKMKEMHLHIGDFFALAAVVLYIAGIFVVNHFLGSVL